jgi:CRP/FNR family transcriptional regulator, polysaccharide utilization system transcription regulator
MGMSKIIETSCLACRNRADIFNALKSHEIEKVDCERVSIHYNAGEVIFKQGAPCNNFICITSGLVKLYLEHENSHNVIIGLIRPVTYIFEPGAFTDFRHHFTAVASEETTACIIDVNIMQHLMKTNPDFATEYINKVSLQAIELFRKISSVTQKHVYGRMADMLIYLQTKVYHDNPFDLTISRQDIADLAGMTKESSIRVLKKFKDDNIISLEGNHIEILNLAKLEAISKSG